jgi:hypothetical protein
MDFRCSNSGLSASDSVAVPPLLVQQQAHLHLPLRPVVLLAQSEVRVREITQAGF